MFVLALLQLPERRTFEYGIVIWAYETVSDRDHTCFLVRRQRCTLAGSTEGLTSRGKGRLGVYDGGE